jgi:hypothetical protein
MILSKIWCRLVHRNPFWDFSNWPEAQTGPSAWCGWCGRRIGWTFWPWDQFIT